MKATKEKNDLLYPRKTIIPLSVGDSWETIEDKRHWNCHIQCAERQKTINHGFYIQLNYPSKIENKQTNKKRKQNKNFLGNKNKEFVTRRFPLQEILKEVFQDEGKWYQLATAYKGRTEIHIHMLFLHNFFTKTYGTI